MPCRFHAENLDLLIVEEGMEQAHGVGAAADGRNQAVGQTPFGLVHLLAGFPANDALEIAHHGRVWVRPRDSSDAVERRFHIGDPVA